jgi:hypothetical protein
VKFDLEYTAVGAGAQREPLVIQAGWASNKLSGSELQSSFLASLRPTKRFERDDSSQVLLLLSLLLPLCSQLNIDRAGGSRYLP